MQILSIFNNELEYIFLLQACKLNPYRINTSIFENPYVWSYKSGKSVLIAVSSPVIREDLPHSSLEVQGGLLVKSGIGHPGDESA
jgi:hypothetical protein